MLFGAQHSENDPENEEQSEASQTNQRKKAKKVKPVPTDARRSKLSTIKISQHSGQQGPQETQAHNMFPRRQTIRICMGFYREFDIKSSKCMENTDLHQYSNGFSYGKSANNPPSLMLESRKDTIPDSGKPMVKTSAKF